MASSTSPSVDNLFPAIAQSFAVIVLGYIFGFFKIIPPSEARSIGTLVGKLALPALLFKNLAILDLSSISWPFLGGILISKFSVFLVVAVITVIIARPFSLGKAGLFGIFATQSNDFALGLPIVQALYGTTYAMGDFNYVSYIYLLAPVSLAIINPIGFCLMEYEKQSSKSKLNMKQIPLIALRTMKGVVLNPVIFMTVLGIIVNVIITYGVHHGEVVDSEDKLPSWLVGFLDILGGAYAACALFNIGIFMVGKLKKVTGTVIIIATLLIIAKTVFLPFIAYRVLYVLLPNGTNTTTQNDIATFGFLLGTFPTAPTVFVFANQYHLAMEIIAASLVLCTFMSAPIMYISARMVLISYASDEQYSSIIEEAQRDVSFVTLICVIWVFTLFLIARRYRSYAHVFVMHLMVAMVLEVAGVEFLGLVRTHNQIYWEFFFFGLFFMSVLSTRTWMASLSIGLYLLVKKGPRIAEKAWLPLMFISWGVPILISGLLVTICAAVQTKAHRQTLVDISFLFGEVQLILSLMVLILCASIALVFVIMTIIISHKNRKKNKSTANSSSDSSPHSSPLLPTQSDKTLKRRLHPDVTTARTHDDQPLSMNYGTETLSTESTKLYSSLYQPPDASDGFDTVVNFHGSVKNGARSAAEVEKEEEATEKSPLLRKKREISPEPYSMALGQVSESAGVWYRDNSGKHLNRFLVLMLFLVFSSLVGILIVIWKLTTTEASGIFIAVNVLDTVTNFGQGFFVFAVFGFEKHWFWVVIYKKLRNLLFRVETVVLPLEKDLEVAVITLCSNFKDRYLQNCKEDIVSDKRYYFRVYESVFVGSELVDWLVDKGIVSTREDATEYGQSLLVGRVISHVSEEHYFHDEKYFYRFNDSSLR